MRIYTNTCMHTDKSHTNTHTHTHIHTQGKDGSQLKGANGQPSGIRLRLAYGKSASTTAKNDSGTPTPQLPPGWEKKTDREHTYDIRVCV
jgi:hypothetical protein